MFHTAAYKHVDLCERSPFEAVQTNILGVQNVISAASENKVERVIFTSSDKAVNPSSVMGTSKLMGERLMTAANSNLRGDGPIFTSTRFGNVLGSRGSVIHIFREQIRRGIPVTLTDNAMTRFIMSITEAVRLVIESAYLARGGEVFITKMPVIRIQDLAEVMIRELAPVYGHELYFVVLPAFASLYGNIDYHYPNILVKDVSNPYNSAVEKPISKDQLADFLKDNDLLGEDASDRLQPAEPYQPVFSVT